MRLSDIGYNDFKRQLKTILFEWTAAQHTVTLALCALYKYSYLHVLTYLLTYLLTYCCLYGQAPRYLADHLTPASEVACCLQFIVHRCRLCNYRRRAFSIAGPAIWNSLLDELISGA